MSIVIKEMRVRTTVERRIIAESEVSDELIRKIEDRVVDRLSATNSSRNIDQRRRNER